MEIFLILLLINYGLLTVFIYKTEYDLTLKEYIIICLPLVFLLIYLFCLIFIVVEIVYYKMKRIINKEWQKNEKQRIG